MLLMEQTNYFSFDKCNSSFNSRNFCFLTTSWSPTPLVVLLTAVTSIVNEWLLYLFLDKYADMFSWLTLDTLAYFLTANIYINTIQYMCMYIFISDYIVVWWLFEVLYQECPTWIKTTLFDFHAWLQITLYSSQ